MNVTLELDSGPFEMAFAYVPMGEPAFSDVPDLGEDYPSHEEAERAGAQMLCVGNWRWFRIEKRYAKVQLIDGGESNGPTPRATLAVAGGSPSTPASTSQTRKPKPSSGCY